MFKENIKVLSLMAVFLLGYYMFVTQTYIAKNPVNEFPSLRARFGTVMWHSEDSNGLLNASIDPQLHTYCYYPKAAANKGGEYILKRVKDYRDCKDWYGITQLKESYWVSEREKIWWSKEQFISDSLATKEDNTSPNN